MIRSLLPIAGGLALAGASVSIHSYSAGSVEAATPTGPVNSLITLPDGSTMASARGSFSRAIGDWLAKTDSGSGEFQFTGFDERRAVLTTAGIGRGADLATMLRAAPAATIDIAGDDAQAHVLRRLLLDKGISEERVTVVPAARVGVLTLTLHRGSTAPLLTAAS